MIKESTTGTTEVISAPESMTRAVLLAAENAAKTGDGAK